MDDISKKRTENMLGLSRAGLTSPGMQRQTVRRIGEAAGLGLVPGYSALYLCDEGSGSVIVDGSGNNYNGAFGAGAAAPKRITGGGLGFDGADDYGSFADLSPALAGKPGLTVIVVARSSRTPFSYAPLFGYVSNLLPNVPFTLWAEHTLGGGSGADNIAFGINTDPWGSATYAGMPGALAQTYECLTGRFIGGESVQIRRGTGPWATKTTSVPATTYPTCVDAIAVGRGHLDYLPGVIAAWVIYPFALTDQQCDQAYAYLAALMAHNRVALGAPVPPVALAIGDSITEGLYPAYLQLPLCAPVTNAGVGGDTTAMMLARLPALLAQYAPPAVLILGGTNDIVGGAASAAIISNLSATVAAVATRAVLLTVPPGSTYNAAKNTVLGEVNAWIAAQVASNVIIADVHAALKDPETPTQLLAAYDSGDGIHPNAAGMQVIANTVYAALQGAGWV